MYNSIWFEVGSPETPESHLWLSGVSDYSSERLGVRSTHGVRFHRSEICKLQVKLSLLFFSCSLHPRPARDFDLPYTHKRLKKLFLMHGLGVQFLQSHLSVSTQNIALYLPTIPFLSFFLCNRILYQSQPTPPASSTILSRSVPRSGPESVSAEGP